MGRVERNGFHVEGTDIFSFLKMDKETKIGYSYEIITEIADYIKACSTHRPTVGVICGSGMGGLARSVKECDVFSYADIPGFPVCTVKGHKGKLILGKIGDVTVVCMQGRFHIFEGYPMWKCALPIRVMKLLGVKLLLVTNAAGGLNPEYNVGDIMLIKDHINLPSFAGVNPLRGTNDERWGPRFLGLNNPYDLNLRNLAKEIGSELGLEDTVKEGVYAMNGGPTYETVAELRMLRILGADAVGMSTAHEVIAAKHCGLHVFGLSLITNMCVMEFDAKTPAANHSEVIQVGQNREKYLERLLTSLIKRIDKAYLS